MIKFYGVTTAGGDINTNYPYSNNFILSKSDSGTYTITFNEWIGSAPIVVANPLSNTISQGQAEQAALIESLSQPNNTAADNNNPAWQVTIKTYDSGSAADISFSLMAICGSNMVVEVADGATVELQPTVVEFGPESSPRKILKTTFTVTSSDGGDTTSYDVDSATAITIVGSSISVDMNTAYTYTDADGTTTDYTLAAYSYQPGDTNSTQWSDKTEGDDSIVTASLSAPGTNIPTTEHRLYITATDSDGNVLWSDPVIRLSKESPDGITADTVGDGT